MQDVITDIETLEDVLINLTEGASDEKRMALNSLEQMIMRKRQEIADFEADLEQRFAYMEHMEINTGRF
jgi:chaperonin GroEL (HSP60 family)